MGRIIRIATVAFYLGKLAIMALWTLPYLRWRVWRAKHAFKKELKRGGLPDELVRTLVDSYNRQNKNVIGLVSGGFSALRNSERRTEASFEESTAKLTCELK